MTHGAAICLGDSNVKERRMSGAREGGTGASMRPAERDARRAGRILVRWIVLNPAFVLVLAALLLRYG